MKNHRRYFWLAVSWVLASFCAIFGWTRRSSGIDDNDLRVLLVVIGVLFLGALYAPFVVRGMGSIWPKSRRTSDMLLFIELALILLLNVQYFVGIPKFRQMYRDFGCDLPGITTITLSLPVWAAVILSGCALGVSLIRIKWSRLLICVLLVVANLCFAFAFYAPFLSLVEPLGSPKM
jgi:hypothetical protein